MNRISCFLFLLVSFHLSGQSGVRPLPNAHAHNDYEHEHPLYDALKHGFTSVEADVHLIGGQLYVSHDAPLDLVQTPTLVSLYLEPLALLVKQQKGQVYQGYEAPFQLMIDIKTEAKATYAALKEVLGKYQALLCRSVNGEEIKGPIMIFLSGNRPIAEVQNESIRLVGIDGRPSDIGKGYAAGFMPVISDNYNKHLSWKGKKKKINPDELATLKAWVDQAHQEGKKVRLWASPENKKVWKLLLKTGVDLLNTDKLAALQQFLQKKK